MTISKYLFSAILLIRFILISSEVIAQITFKEVGAGYNVLHNIGNPTIGGGVCIYDFDQDGLDDLTLGTTAGSPIGFYQNVGDKFELLTPLVNNFEEVKQINWVDFDNDGDPDLYVTAFEGINRLYRNNGNLQLQDITEVAGLPLDWHYGFGASWGDYNRDGWIDLYYASKGTFDTGGYNRLFKNNADGTFSEVTYEAEASDEGKFPFCAAFFDYNNDMWPDLYIANDKLTYNTLLENTGRGIFLDVSEATSANARMNAMCVNPGDFNRDGWMDIYITNTPIGSHCLQNTGQLDNKGFIQYEEVAFPLGIHFPGGNGWGSNFLDADNDGDLDLHVCSSRPSPREYTSTFFENIDGNFFRTPAIEGFDQYSVSSFTNAVGDFNNDGQIDIVVNNNPPADFHLWENQTPNDNRWLKVKLKGILSNREGIGSKIEAYVEDMYQMFFTMCGSGFLGQNSSFKHIGMAQYEALDSLIITWPTGHIDKLYNIEADQIVEVQEGISTNGNIDLAEGVFIKNSQIPTHNPIKETSFIKIYPNPGKDHISLESIDPVKHIQVWDANGRICTEFKDMSNNRSQVLNTANLPKGIYFLHIVFEQKAPTYVKWIKL